MPIRFSQIFPIDTPRLRGGKRAGARGAAGNADFGGAANGMTATSGGDVAGGPVPGKTSSFALGCFRRPGSPALHLPVAGMGGAFSGLPSE